MWKHVSDEGHFLMQQWHNEGLGVKTVAKRLCRSTDTVSEQVYKKHGRGTNRPVDRPPAITPSIFKNVGQTCTKMIAKTKVKTEITVAKVKRRMRLTCCEKLISRALWSNTVHARPHCEKPALSEQGPRAR